jgi:hypothetical protein
LYSLQFRNSVDQDRLARTYLAYPWKGGYSTVNFYFELNYLVPLNDRPVVKAIRYESPGVIELALAIAVAVSLRRVVANVAAAIRDVNSTYDEIYRGMQQRRLLRLDVREREMKLERDQEQFLLDSFHRLSALLGIPESEVLLHLTGSPLAAVKVLLSVYRRAKQLQELQRRGNVQL